MAKQWTSIKLNQYETDNQGSAKLGIVIVNCAGYTKLKDKASGESRFYPRPNNGDPVIGIKSRCLTATDALILKGIIEAQLAEAAAAQVKAAMEEAKLAAAALSANEITSELVEIVA